MSDWVGGRRGMDLDAGSARDLVGTAYLHSRLRAEREGQTPGDSPFVSLIGRLRMIGKFRRRLASAAANALSQPSSKAICLSMKSRSA